MVITEKVTFEQNTLRGKKMNLWLLSILKRVTRPAKALRQELAVF